MPNARRYCFTFNNPKRHNSKQFVNELKEKCTYIIIGREYAPDTGTPHLQGYCIFREPQSIKQLKKLNKKVHWEKCMGCHTKNVAYCSKEDRKPWIYDVRRQGCRTDLDIIAEQLNGGASPYEVSRIFPATYIRNYKGIESWSNMRQSGPVRPRTAKPYVKWYHGPSGSGKTRKAAEEAGDDVYWLDNINDMTGYTGQQTVIVDDFRETDIPFKKMLRLLDRYPLTLNVKYGSTQFNSSVIVITSPYPPEQAYQTNEEVQQLLRRLDDVKYFGNPADDYP